MKSESSRAHTIDATGKRLGRLASDIAMLLQGKRSADFDPSVESEDVVTVQHVEQMAIDQKKLDEKVYMHHSGYPGGIKTTKMKDLFAKNPKEVLRRAVINMLPKNKLRSQAIKRLMFQ